VADPERFAAGVSEPGLPMDAVEEIPFGDGTVLERYAATTRDGAGRISGRVIFFRDVTRRKWVEAELRERAAQQAAVATLGELAMNAEDPEPLLGAACATVVDTLRLDAAVLLELGAGEGRLAVRATSGVDPEAVPPTAAGPETLAGAALQAQGSAVTLDARHEWPSDPLALALGACSAAAAVLHGRDGPTGVLVALGRAPRAFNGDDVHFLEAIASTLAAALARSRADSEVLERERQMRAVFEHALDAMVLVDDQGVVVDVNEAGCALFRAPRTEIVGRSLLDVAPPSPEAAAGRRAAQVAVLQRGEASGETEIQRGPEVRTIEFQARALIWPGRHLVVLRDVTERKQLHARLALADRMISVGTLAAGVAHELNNPLAYVNANLSFLGERLEALARDLETDRPAGTTADLVEQLADALRDARDGAERMRLIIRDLRTFSRGDDSKDGPVELGPVVESCVAMAWNEIRHRARLEKDLAPVPPVRATEARLGQVFLNLLVNAAHAIPEGHVDANVIRVCVRLASPKRVAVEIRDTGSGIAPENLRRVFDPFFTTKPPGVGTGLGLSICHGIVASLGGEIAVESEVGRGSTFRVLLPVAAGAPAHSGSRPVPAAPARGRLLVVDDEPLVGTVIQRTLRAEHDVVVVSSASAALERIERGERFDLILSDLLMPEMSGMDLYRVLAARHPALTRRIVFLTGGAFTPDAREFLDRETVTCVEKPFELQGIRALLARKLGELG
jgi:PAS domain S-box-containing protein